MIIFFLITSLSLDTILNTPELSNSFYGICIVNLESQDTIFESNANKLLVPASNMKIVTTAAALYFLGTNFQFKTRLFLRGEIKERRLYGDIIVQGEGDPTFSLTNLERFVSRIENYGIKEITGSICIVDDYFTNERLPVGWSWHYLDAKYAPEISALSLNKNVVSVRIRPTSIGEYASVSLFPQTGYVQLVNNMKTTATNDSIIIYRKPEANTIIVEGAISTKSAKDIDVAVKDPGLFAGEYFRERLIARGIRIANPVTRIRSFEMFINESKLVLIDSVLSVPLSEIIKETNTESENLYAEILLKTLGAQKYREGSFNAGLNVLREFLNVCGVDTGNISIWDGSGLSKHNLISCSALISILKFMYQSKLFQDFYSSLPEPGKGTLKYRFNGFSDTLRAKTGAIQASSCLSGYIKTNGIHYAFSMLFNNFTCASKKILNIQEKIIRAFIEEERKNNNKNVKTEYPSEVIQHD
ncbi:MAG: D-alanyl-D-alanine carboxypeptidase/D-alanyl-D-alanine-endopeptidase [candidate division WOR-3 bacterium]